MSDKIVSECPICGDDLHAEPAYFADDHKKVYANVSCRNKPCDYRKISWYDADEVDFAFIGKVHGWR